MNNIDGATPMSSGELDRALAHWARAPLPPGFVASTMVRVRAQPRFRLSAADALVAFAAALVGSGVVSLAASLSRTPDGPVLRAASLAAARMWLALRPADPQLIATVVASVALALVAVAVASWIGRAPRAWTALGR